MKRIVHIPRPHQEDLDLSGMVPLGNDYFDVDERVELPKSANVKSSGRDRYSKLAKADREKVEKEEGVQPHQWLGE